MRTGRSLTVWRGGGGLPAGGSLSGGLLAGGVSLPGGVLPTGDPPVNRMTNRCKNITLATTSLRPVISSLDLD